MINFKRFRNYTIEPNNRINILVGDNETGKSTVLEAIDLVSNGSIKAIDTIGLDALLNIEAVKDFNEGPKSYETLPKLIIELYIDGDNLSHELKGTNNSDQYNTFGIRLVCEPNDDYRSEIIEFISSSDNCFPYEFYSIQFTSFAGIPYTSYKKKVRSVLIDSTKMNTDYATSDFIKRMYNQYTETSIKERALHKSQFRLMKNSFDSQVMNELNGRVPAEKGYAFGLKQGGATDFEKNLMIYEDNISVSQKGTGKQIFIKTDFALDRIGENNDIVLIEEPENHLSHNNLRKLIHLVANTQKGQLFITTHSSLISARLEIKNLIILQSVGLGKPVTLKDLSDDTAKYFMKSPPAGIIEYSLSNKTILVEGPSEYMLMDLLYYKVTGHHPDSDGIQIIDIRGLSFKRYLEIAHLLHNKVAVITDNDGDIQNNIIKKYSEYDSDDNIAVFYHEDTAQTTFEIVFYGCNKDLCDSLFGNNALEYMLHNKTEAAYRIIMEDEQVTIPEYIESAITWIKD